MYQSELDIRYSRDRYEDELVAARIRRLIRSAQQAQPPVAPPARQESLFARVVEALRLRRPARA